MVAHAEARPDRGWVDRREAGYGETAASSAPSRASPAVPRFSPGWPPLECRAPAWPPGRSVVPLAPVAITARFVEPLSALLPQGRGHAKAELESLTQPLISLRPGAEHGCARLQLGVIGYDERPIRCLADKFDDRIVRAARSRMNHGDPTRPADGRESHRGVRVEHDDYLDRGRELPAKRTRVDVVGQGLVRRTPLIRAIDQNTGTARQGVHAVWSRRFRHLIKPRDFGWPRVLAIHPCRGRIAAHGKQALSPKIAWLSEPAFGSFAVWVLKTMADEPDLVDL